jgi:MFS family permease
MPGLSSTNMASPSPDKDNITHIEQAPPPGEKSDTAAKWLAEAQVEGVRFTYEEERAVLKRIDHRVLPLLLGAYFFQQLDKSSLSYVSIFGLQQDANLVGRQYSWLGSILYMAQLVMQPLAAFLLVKLPVGKLIAGAIFLWGCSLAIMAACTDFKSLLALRFVLGSFEAMIAPACVATTTMWWRRSEQTLRTGAWNAMNGLTFIVGSLFTYGLGHIESGALYKYQTIFLFCGLLTVVYAAVVLVLTPDSPMSARYLSERERVIAVERLRANQMGIQSGHWRWDQVWETFYDLKTWCWFVAIVAIS